MLLLPAELFVVLDAVLVLLVEFVSLLFDDPVAVEDDDGDDDDESLFSEELLELVLF